MVSEDSMHEIDRFELWCWKSLDSALDGKEIKLVNPKGNQPWIVIGRTNAEAEALITWPHDAKSRLVGKHPGTGEDGRHKEKGVKEVEVVGLHCRLNGHEIEHTPEDNEACCSPWGHKEMDTT